MEEVKYKINNIVNNYISMFSDEYNIFVKAQNKRIETTLNDFAELKGNTFINRKLFEIPEKLFTMFKIKLTSEEFDWLFPIKNDLKGSHWFAKKYKQFRASKRI